MEINEVNSVGDSKEFCLVLDLGGTNLDIAVGAIDEEYKIIFSTKLKTIGIKNLEEPINSVINIAKEKYGIEIKKACLAVPGPMNSERTISNPTNIEWSVDVKTILKKTSLNEVSLINDFEAIGYGIECLSEDEFETINSGNEHFNSPRIVVGPGTGLGASIMNYNFQKMMHTPLPSEAGSSNVVVIDREELGMVEAIKIELTQKEMLRYEDLLSGQGIINIYEVIKDEYERVSKIEKLEGEEKTARIIQGEEEVCEKTREIFVTFCARFARNLAITAMSLDGVYIAGGIAAKNHTIFTNFMKEFTMHSDSEFVEILGKIPVKVIKNYDISLYGAMNVVKKCPELAQHL